MDETLQQGVNLTNQQIAEALSYGVPEEDIYNHLRQSADPHHMEVVRRYDMAKGAEKFNAQPQQQTSPQSVNTDIVDLMSEHPVATGLLGLGGAALLGTGAYALKTGVVDPWATGRQEAAKLKAQAEAEPSPAIKVQQEQNALAARRLDLETQQMQNSASIADNVKPAQEMSPFDAEKLKKMQLENERIQIAIDNLKAEEARKQAVHEANQAASQAKKAAQTKQTTGGTITETEAGMLAADQTAKIQKAIDADQKAAAAKAAIPAQTAPAPVAPTPSPTVQLTPSPEVAAEVAPKTTKAPKPPKQVPEGFVFKEGLGSGDNWLFNTYGEEGRKAILKQFNEGKPAVSYERALELSAKAQEAKPGPMIPREVARERGIAPPETNYGKLGQVAKYAGAAGLLMAASQAAKAAQRGDYTEAAKIGVPAVAGAVSPTAGGVASAVAEPELAATDLSRMSPMIGMLSKILLANEKKKK